MIDSLQTSILVASSGLEAQSRRIRVASENLANADSAGKTPGADPYTRKVVTFDNVMDETSGANLVSVDSIENDTTPYRVEHNPSHPAADADGNVKLPNVNMLVEMADIREASRSYEANIQAIKQARDMISMTIDLLRTS